MATRAPKTAAAPVAAAVDTTEGTAAQPVAAPLPADSLQDDAADNVGADDAPADDGQADDADDDYPLTLTLTNTSGHVFSCSVTGVVSQSGSVATVTLHDRAHAHAFADSLEQFTRYLPADAVKVDRA